MTYAPGDASVLTPPPAHVPAHLIQSFDYFSPPGAELDPHAAWKRLHEGPAIFYTPLNGGHWVVTRSKDLFAAMQDFEHFSSHPFNIPARPSGTPKTIPLEIDPPELNRYRQLVIRKLSPRSLAPLEPGMREAVTRLIEELKPSGGAEFVSACAVRMPVELFLQFVQLPVSDLPRVRSWIESIARDPDRQAHAQALEQAFAYMAQVIEQRSAHPGEDVFSTLVHAEREGQISREETISMALNIFFGGIETVTSALSFIMRFLAENPKHRRQLASDPALCTPAVEEFMRRFGILNLGRTIKRNITLSGVEMREGDRVLLPIHLYSLDDEMFERPMDVDFHRAHFRHINFGAGPHRCLGSNLARPELRIFLEEWTRRIPDFELSPDNPPRAQSGAAMAVTHLPLVWKVA
ncbi:MAG: cytochrome P450 [Hyphomonadaceae bacterium]|nr:cytochrome P450 [Hyphomonadaceae bacterium]